MKYTKKWLVYLACVVAGWFMHEWVDYLQQPPPGIFEAVVVEVYDGDSVKVNWAKGTNQMNRLRGIDALESRKSSKLYDQLKHFGLTMDQGKSIAQAAKQLVVQQCLSNNVTMVFSEGRVKVGDFGRPLCYLEINGQDLGLTLLDQGLVYCREEPHPKSAAYCKQQDWAKFRRSGLWRKHHIAAGL